MNEEQKRIKAIIDEQIRLLAENPKLKGKTDAQLWGNELRSRAMKSRMNDPEYRAKWDENNKIGGQKRSQNPELRKKTTLANQKKAHNPEWREKNKLAREKLYKNTEWRENQKLGIKLRTDSNLEWRENQKLAMQKLAQDPEHRAKNTLATQKACNKQISCDGVIYASKIQAALALAPETRLTHGSKSSWLTTQMKKFPERYFYVTKSE